MNGLQCTHIYETDLTNLCLQDSPPATNTFADGDISISLISNNPLASELVLRGIDTVNITCSTLVSKSIQLTRSCEYQCGLVKLHASCSVIIPTHYSYMYSPQTILFVSLCLQQHPPPVVNATMTYTGGAVFHISPKLVPRWCPW